MMTIVFTKYSVSGRDRERVMVSRGYGDSDGLFPQLEFLTETGGGV